jgi:hypothetical protein
MVKRFIQLRDEVAATTAIAVPIEPPTAATARKNLHRGTAERQCKQAGADEGTGGGRRAQMVKRFMQLRDEVVNADATVTARLGGTAFPVGRDSHVDRYMAGRWRSGLGF